MKHSPFIVCDFKIKQVDESSDPDNFIIEGLASPYGNIDSYKDIVMPGAFTTSLIKDGTSRSILWQHRSAEPVGVGEMEDSTAGLKTRIKLPKSDTFVTGRVMPQVRIRSVKGLSIGYRTIKEEYDNVSRVNRLIEVDLKEVSLVTFPANEMAQVLAAKQFLGIEEVKHEFKMYSLADEKTEWNEAEAIQEIKENTGCKTDASKFYFKGFLDFANGSKSFDDYRLPYVKYIDNEFKIVPKAIYEITGALNGRKGFEEVKEFVNSVYVKMGKEEPFKSGDRIFIDKATLKNMKKSDIKSVFDNENVILSSGSKEMIVEALRSGKAQGSVLNEDNEILSFLKNANEEFTKI